MKNSNFTNMWKKFKSYIRALFNRWLEFVIKVLRVIAWTTFIGFLHIFNALFFTYFGELYLLRKDPTFVELLSIPSILNEMILNFLTNEIFFGKLLISLVKFFLILFLGLDESGGPNFRVLPDEILLVLCVLFYFNYPANYREFWRLQHFMRMKWWPRLKFDLCYAIDFFMVLRRGYPVDWAVAYARWVMICNVCKIVVLCLLYWFYIAPFLTIY